MSMSSNFLNLFLSAIEIYTGYMEIDIILIINS